MTGRARGYWLDISYHLKIPPRQQDELTMREWEDVVAAIDEIREEAKKG